MRRTTIIHNAALALLAAAAAGVGGLRSAAAEDISFELGDCCASGGSGCCDDEEPYYSYGPCDCQPRGTLFQWSYGTSFRGGPPGFDEPLVTDRPDFTEASTTVGRGVLQLEFGYTYIEAADGTRTDSFPELLVRYGILADWLELRIAGNYAEETMGATTVTGADDLYLGFKIALTPQEGILPEMAFVPQMFVPIGGPFTANEVLPGGNLIYGWEINDFISTAGQTQFNRAIDEGTSAAYTEFSQSWTIAYSLTDCVGAYTEWFMFAPDGADTAQTEHFLDGGFTFLLNNNTQFDIRAGVGLSDTADDYFVGVGMSQRL